MVHVVRPYELFTVFFDKFRPSDEIGSNLSMRSAWVSYPISSDEHMGNKLFSPNYKMPPYKKSVFDILPPHQLRS
jgi:hypothetical protein